MTEVTAHAGAVTLIQRFGSALNLNIHFHLLVLDGVYVGGKDRLAFRRVAPPTKRELDFPAERVREIVDGRAVRPMSERRSSGCAATLPGQPSPPGGCRSPPKARCATR